MRNIFKKAFLIIACIMGIMISGMTVSAAVYRTTTSRINLRSKAGTLSSDTIICTIPKGTKLQLIGKSTKYSNWYYTEYKGKTGFVEGTYLTSVSSSSNEEESGDSIRTISVNLNLRSSAKITSSNVITVLPKGTKVSLIRKSGNWYYVETSGGQKGYIADGYFTSSSASGGTYKITTVAVNMRTSAKVANGNIIMTVPSGKRVRVLGTSGNWYKVSYNGRTGYMKSGYFKDESASSSYVTEKTAVNLRLRSSKSTSANNVITTIPKGTSIRVYQESNGWYYVAYGSRKGYVKSGYFVSDSSSPSVSSSGQTGHTTANVRLRSSRSTSSSSNIILVIPKGRTVTILSESGSWYKVRYNGQTGYVSSDYVS